MAKLVQTERRKNDLSIFFAEVQPNLRCLYGKVSANRAQKNDLSIFYAEVQPNLRYYKAKLQIKNGNSVVVCLFSSNLRTGDGDLG